MAVVACVLISHPFAEMGQNDDWSYIWSAKVLAQTGQVHYFGWTTPIIGWQLYLGALLIKLFGFRFSVVRCGVLLIAATTAYILQRVAVRAGVRGPNAVVMTLCILASPLYLPLAFSFMSDAGGLFSIVLCMYFCLRVLEAETPRSTLGWFAVAAITGVLSGTVRQIAWLGVLVMVPSAGFVVRRRLPVAPALAIYGLSVAGVFGILRWFSHQPYVQPEGLLDSRPDRVALANAVVGYAHGVLGFAFFLLPLLLAFVARPPALSRRRALGWAVAVLLPCVAAACALGRAARLNWLAPFTGNYVTDRGLVDINALAGRPPVTVTPGVRLVLTAVTLAAAGAFLLWRPWRAVPPAKSADRLRTGEMLSAFDLAMLLLPFSVVYVLLLAPRAMANNFYDRYLLPLLVVASMFLLRFFQERVGERLPAVCLACVGLYAAYGIAGLHDVYANERARLGTIAEMHARGLPDTAFYGGYEYDGWTQLTRGGYINSQRILRPHGAFHDPGAFLDGHPCGDPFSKLYPVIQPHFMLSFEPAGCDGASSFAPVMYRTWLPPFRAVVYVDVIQNPEDVPAGESSANR